MHECRLCTKTISLGQRYYDGGLKWRAHEECVPKPITATLERCCASEHEPPDTACKSFEAGQNGRCVYCDHEQKCHPGPGATCEIGVTELGKVSVLLTNQELEDIFVALENYSWSQERKQRCRAIILRIRPYLQRQVDEIRFSESRCKL